MLQQGIPGIHVSFINNPIFESRLNVTELFDPFVLGSCKKNKQKL